MSNRVGSAIRDLLGETQHVGSGVATDVDMQAKTCTVLPDDGNPPIYDVRFALLPDVHFYAAPADKSPVIYAHISRQVAVVLHCDTPKEVVVNTGDTRVIWTAQGWAVERPDAALDVTDHVEISAALVVEKGLTTLEVDAEGVGIKANSQSLATILGDLISAIQTLAPIAAAPGSPCVPSPADIAKLTLIAQRLNLVLK
jgi:hypothetical protein